MLGDWYKSKNCFFFFRRWRGPTTKHRPPGPLRASIRSRRRLIRLTATAAPIKVNDQFQRVTVFNSYKRTVVLICLLNNTRPPDYEHYGRESRVTSRKTSSAQRFPNCGSGARETVSGGGGSGVPTVTEIIFWLRPRGPVVDSRLCFRRVA